MRPGGTARVRAAFADEHHAPSGVAERGESLAPDDATRLDPSLERQTLRRKLGEESLRLEERRAVEVRGRGPRRGRRGGVEHQRARGVERVTPSALRHVEIVQRVVVVQRDVVEEILGDEELLHGARVAQVLPVHVLEEILRHRGAEQTDVIHQPGVRRARLVAAPAASAKRQRGDAAPVADGIRGVLLRPTLDEVDVKRHAVSARNRRRRDDGEVGPPTSNHRRVRGWEVRAGSVVLSREKRDASVDVRAAGAAPGDALFDAHEHHAPTVARVAERDENLARLFSERVGIDPRLERQTRRGENRRVLGGDLVRRRAVERHRQRLRAQFERAILSSRPERFVRLGVVAHPGGAEDDESVEHVTRRVEDGDAGALVEPQLEAKVVDLLVEHCVVRHVLPNRRRAHGGAPDAHVVHVSRVAHTSDGVVHAAVRSSQLKGSVRASGCDFARGRTRTLSRSVDVKVHRPVARHHHRDVVPRPALDADGGRGHIDTIRGNRGRVVDVEDDGVFGDCVGP